MKPHSLALPLLFLPLLMSLELGDARPSVNRSAADPHSERPALLTPYVRLADADVLPASASHELTVRYLLEIARGHVLAAVELAKAGRTDQSVVHSRHALDEAWQELGRVLPADDAHPLRQKIAAVNEAIALKLPLPEIHAASEALNVHIESLARGLLRNGISRHRQKLDIIVLLLRQAQLEYEVAWKGLQLTDLAEYQDGFGFVLIARSELRDVQAEMNSENPAAAAEIQKSVEHIARAWPSLDAPAKPAMSKPVLRALVAAVELNARRFAR